eukprot:Sdes_comp13212_c0_seq1m3098
MNILLLFTYTTLSSFYPLSTLIVAHPVANGCDKDCSKYMPFTLLTGGDVYTPDYVGKKDILLGGSKILALLPPSTSFPKFLPQGQPCFASLFPQEAAGLIHTIDVTGMLVTPGLLDPHSHIIGGGGELGPESMIPEARLSQIIQSGVTTVVGTLGTDSIFRKPERLMAKVISLRHSGITAFLYIGSYRLPPLTLSGDIMKDISMFESVIGVGELAIADHRSSNPSHQDISKLAADIHIAGILAAKSVVLHCHVGKEPEGLDALWRVLNSTALPIRLFYPTHVSNRGGKLLQEGVEWILRGGYLDFTCDQNFTNHIGNETLDALDHYRGIKDLDMSHITLSTDSYGSFPIYNDRQEIISYKVQQQSSLLLTLKRLVLERHWKLEDALKLCTSNTASYLGFKGKGVLGVGFDADLLVFSNFSAPNPFQLQYVFSAGEMRKSPSFVQKDMFEE